MRCDILFLASFLPAVLVQSRSTQPSDGYFAENGTVTLSNSKGPSGHPLYPTDIPHPANLTAPNSSRWNSSKPTNRTSGYGVCRKKNSTSAALNATSAITNPTVLPTQSGRLPITKGNGFHFANSTVEGQRPTRIRASFHPSSTSAPSGFAHLTGVSKPHNTTVLTGGRAPYTRAVGAAFTNRTTEFSDPTRVVSLSRTGASSGFAKPSGGKGFTRPATHATRQASSSGRLPITSSKGLYFGNSTAVASVAPTTLPETGPAPIFATGSDVLKPASTASRSLPYAITKGAGFTNATSTMTPSSSSSISVPLYTAPVTSATAVNTTAIIPSSAISTSIQTQIAAINTSSTELPSSTSLFSLVGTSLTTSSSILSTTVVPTFLTVTRAPYTNTTSLSLFNPAPTTLSTLTSASPSTAMSPASFTTISASITVPISGTLIVTAVPDRPTSEVVLEYYQCGGINWKGGRECVKGTYCKNQNPYYHQCVRR